MNLILKLFIAFWLIVIGFMVGSLMTDMPRIVYYIWCGLSALAGGIISDRLFKN